MSIFKKVSEKFRDGVESVAKAVAGGKGDKKIEAFFDKVDTRIEKEQSSSVGKLMEKAVTAAEVTAVVVGGTVGIKKLAASGTTKTSGNLPAKDDWFAETPKSEPLLGFAPKPKEVVAEVAKASGGGATGGTTILDKVSEVVADAVTGGSTKSSSIGVSSPGSSLQAKGMPIDLSSTNPVVLIGLAVLVFLALFRR